MKSLRSWLIGIAIGATLFFSAPSAKAQTPISGVPRTITYQGLLLQGGVPYSGLVQLDFYFSDSVGVPLYHQTLSGVVVDNGIFDV